MPKPKPAAVNRTNLRMIPLADLTLSALNPRQHVTDAEIDAMGDSIAQLGLLQNLIGLDTGAGVEIVAGGKRLRALRASEDYYIVPVLVTTDAAEAVAMAGAENNARKDLNPADEIQTYLNLFSRGLGRSVIAATYGTTERRVMQMLKLAELPAAIMANLAAGKISTEQARAFTVGRSDAAMIDALEPTLRQGLNPAQIRHILTPGTVSSNDWRLGYVGIDAYLAAGGDRITDLFSDLSYLTDEPLLQKLFVAKGQADTDTLRTDGDWVWATFVPEKWVNYPLYEKMTALHKAQTVLPEGDAARLAVLDLQGESTAFTPAEAAEFDSLNARAAGDYADNDRATGGIFTLVKDGKLVIYGAYRRPQDAPAAVGADGVTVTTLPAAEPKGFPQSLRDDLARIKLAAEQRALIDHPGLLLDLLAYQLADRHAPWGTALAITATTQKVQPEVPDGTTLDDRLTPPEADRIDPTANGFAAFLELGSPHRDRVLTTGLARTFRLAQGDLHDWIADTLRPDIRAIWTPTAKGFFGRTSAGYMDSVWTALLGGTLSNAVLHDFGPLKKAAKAAELERLFSDMSYREALCLSREENAVIDAWLPPELGGAV